MNKRQAEAIELASRIRDGSIRGEEAIKCQAAIHGDWKPRNLISELNKVGQTPAVDGLVQLQVMRHARQLQPDQDHRFAQAMGKQETGRGGRDDPVHPAWSDRQQREWESSRSAPGFNQREWEQGRQRKPQPSGVPVRDLDSEGRMPVSPREGTPSQRGSEGIDIAHIGDNERVESAAELERKAYAQIRQIIAAAKRQASRYGTY